jgi:hypothetical protein
MAKESLWDGFRRRLGKLGEEAKGWFDSNLKDFFKTADSRPFWMQLLQWVTGGFIKMDAKSLEKNKDDVWTAPRAIFGAAAGVGAVLDHVFAKDEEKEKRAKEATEAIKNKKANKEKANSKKDEQEAEKEKGQALSVSSGDHGFENMSGVFSETVNNLSTPLVAQKEPDKKKSHVERLSLKKAQEVTSQNQL